MGRGLALDPQPNCPGIADLAAIILATHTILVLDGVERLSLCIAIRRLLAMASSLILSYRRSASHRAQSVPGPPSQPGSGRTSRPPWYRPVCPAVWEGRSREAPPIRSMRWPVGEH